MKKNKQILAIFLVLMSFIVHAQTNFGGEIVSKTKFGHGLMVVRAKIVPISGTVSNMFFFNREDQPWNGNRWYEYDWEIRGKSPFNGWSQIRVRKNDGGQLRDAPKNVGVKVNLSKEFYHYILVRQGNKYVYDIRKHFNPWTYDYYNPNWHNGNSPSLIYGGARVQYTGGWVSHIPSWKKLDFSLGITAFDNNWAGFLPNGAYSKEMLVDYARFYGFKNNSRFLVPEPQWRDEFEGNSIKYWKWQVANWYTAKTQFTPNNVKVKWGHLYLKINRNSRRNTKENIPSLVINRSSEFAELRPEKLDLNNQSNSINCYPNPFKTSTTFKLKNAGKIDNVKIFNIQGKLIKSYDNIESNETKIGKNLESGFYIAHIQTKNNIELFKIIKE